MPKYVEDTGPAICAYTKAFGRRFWYFAVVGAVELAGGIDWLLAKVSPPLPQGVEVPLWLFLLFVFGGILWASFHTWRDEREGRLRIEDRVKPDEPPEEVLRAFIEEGQQRLASNSDNALFGPGAGEWQKRVEKYLRTHLGESSVSRFKSPVRGRPDNFELPGQTSRRVLLDRLDRLREIRDKLNDHNAA